jgi:hypothetical protein
MLTIDREQAARRNQTEDQQAAAWDATGVRLSNLRVAEQQRYRGLLSAAKRAGNGFHDVVKPVGGKTPLFRRMPQTWDWLAERSEFELPVPICEQSDNTIRLRFATSRRTASAIDRSAFLVRFRVAGSDRDKTVCPFTGSSNSPRSANESLSARVEGCKRRTRTSRLQTPWCRCDCEPELKIEIPRLELAKSFRNFAPRVQAKYYSEQADEKVDRGS